MMNDECRLAQIFEAVGDDTEELGLELRGEGDGGIGGVLRKESDGGVRAHVEAFDGEFTADGGDDDVAVAGGEAAVNNEDIAVADAGTYHAFTPRTDEVGSGRMADAEVVEVERSVEFAHGRAGETGSDGFVEKGDARGLVFRGLAHSVERMITRAREKFNQNGIYT